MLIHQFLETNARLFPDKDAVINLGKRLTYRQLDEDANRLANSLIAGGVRPGDRVGILVESSIDYIISFFAILKAGGVLVGLNTDTTGRILKSVLSDCSASGIKANEYPSFAASSVTILKCRGAGTTYRSDSPS